MILRYRGDILTMSRGHRHHLFSPPLVSLVILRYRGDIATMSREHRHQLQSPLDLKENDVIIAISLRYRSDVRDIDHISKNYVAS